MVSSYSRHADDGIAMSSTLPFCSKLEVFIQYWYGISDKENQQYCRHRSCNQSPHQTAAAVGRSLLESVSLVGQQARQEKSHAPRLSAQADQGASLVEQRVQTCVGWSPPGLLVNIWLARW